MFTSRVCASAPHQKDATIPMQGWISILIMIALGAGFALISVLPDYLIRWFNVPFYFGGTSLLIVVGVALDTVRQMESHLLMRNYEGFLKKSKSRSGAFARS